MKILFQPNQVRCEGEPGENILQIAERANVLVDGSCAGTGTCGKCKVRIISGQCNTLTPAESTLTEEEVKRGYRLACQTIPQEDLVIELPGTHQGSSRKKRMASLPEGFPFQPAICKRYLNIKRASMQDQRSDQDRLLDTLAVEGAYLDHHLLPSLHRLLKGDVTVTLDGKRILGLESGDTTQMCYGLAVDIGTTTVVAMLWDLVSCTQVDVSSRTNPQSIYGADVISRIQYCNEGPDSLGRMHQKIIDCINDMIAEMTLSNGISPSHIYDMTAVGNTTMSHLFLGIHPQPMSRTPFAPVFCASQDRLAKELEIQINPLANVHVLPNIAGHVGADISSVLLAIGLKEMNGLHVAIDIGTNGEILLAKDGKLFTCSTAAGPAFEGAEILMGMRAADGAIERVVYVNEDISIGTIENCSPIGICGSGLIDAVACLLEAGAVDSAGRMLTWGEAKATDLSHQMLARIVEYEGKPAFVLGRMENGLQVLLTQNDIREVQLAKGAIFAGIATMMRMVGADFSDLDGVILAGAFGSYIDKRSATRIGLLPGTSIERIISVGNAAGTGACMALMSVSSRKLVDSLAREVVHVELSNSKDFQDEYISSMAFPKR